ncbi:MAG: hypothetical protein Kow0029_14900 [Candidatus Rifleibacteriota bacterium]
MWPRWLRAIATIWVAYDSKKRKQLDFFWVLVVLLLGPIFLPVYMSIRPLLPNERRSGGLLWNIIVNFEKFLIWIAGLATLAVFSENFSVPHDKNIAEVKRAEIKAGSIIGAVAVFILLGIERILFDKLRKRIEG